MFFFKVSKRRNRGIHRQKRAHWLQDMREWLWPSMGLKPMLRWMEIYVKRNRGTAHKSALGAAFGVGVTFTPFFGLHLIIIFLLTRIFPSNFWVGAAASFVGNPWTFPFITVWTFQLGNLVMGADPTARPPQEAPPLHHILDQLPYLWETFMLPMTIGGIPTGFAAGALVYLLLKGNIERYQRLRQRRIEAARNRRAALAMVRLTEGAHHFGSKLREKGAEAKSKLKNTLHSVEATVEEKLDHDNKDEDEPKS